MRITAYLVAVPPMRIVGGEAMTLALLTRSVADGHEVTIVCPSAIVRGTYAGIPVIPTVGTSGAAAVAIREADVIVTHPEIGHGPLDLWHDAPGRVIHIVHNLSRRTIRACKRHRVAVRLANSEWTREGLAEAGVASRVLYPPAMPPDPPGVDLPRAFATMMNLAVAKGGEVFAAVVEACPTIPCLGVVGGYGDQVVPVPAPPNLTVLGHSHAALPLALTRVLLTPSRSETYGMLAAEALMAGVPVLASDLPAHREALGDGATFLPADDTAAWVKATRRLWEQGCYEDAQGRALVEAIRLRQRARDSLDSWSALVDGLR